MPWNTEMQHFEFISYINKLYTFKHLDLYADVVTIFNESLSDLSHCLEYTASNRKQIEITIAVGVCTEEYDKSDRNSLQ